MLLRKVLNNIELECKHINQSSLLYKAYQLDDKGKGKSVINGLKSYLKVDGIKSCDYFFQKNRKIYIVEISDFSSQLDLLQNTFEKINNNDELDRKDKKILKRHTPEKIIKSEIKNKYLNTLLILAYFNIVNLKCKQKIYILVLCIEEYDIQVAQHLMEQLKTEELKNDLKLLIDDIKVLTVGMLKNYLEKI